MGHFPAAMCNSASVLLLQMYNFTSFTVSLNELESGMEKTLPPTDCRLRPDIRGMENGNMGECCALRRLVWVSLGLLCEKDAQTFHQDRLTVCCLPKIALYGTAKGR
jgi:hypothetical protein